MPDQARPAHRPTTSRRAQITLRAITMAKRHEFCRALLPLLSALNARFLIARAAANMMPVA